MIKQRMVRRAHDNIHYAGAVYEYASEFAVSIHNLDSFICTNNKHKISVGEPGFLVAALPHERRKIKFSRLLIVTS